MKLHFLKTKWSDMMRVLKEYHPSLCDGSMKLDEDGYSSAIYQKRLINCGRTCMLYSRKIYV